ncbi:hypothetical protein F5J12DRAFT_973957 [Pisolithus orientalis]|uniref:uncharacterized protein n=1 Tax=Pisolithus orientalis TaxID=936130 RepID=UPI002225488E|nr:uncharacterized protein F5J12DRAFT_973957 [Pisolithus orientalis]KAI5986044.1 hypothetical protein F5J12DRAFT_973957 [Pisolithus orientalis]
MTGITLGAREMIRETNLNRNAGREALVVEKVLGDRRRLYKYLNRHLWVVLTEAKGSCGLYVLDSVKGMILYQAGLVWMKVMGWVVGYEGLEDRFSGNGDVAWRGRNLEFVELTSRQGIEVAVSLISNPILPHLTEAFFKGKGNNGESYQWLFILELLSQYGIPIPFVELLDRPLKVIIKWSENRTVHVLVLVRLTKHYVAVSPSPVPRPPYLQRVRLPALPKLPAKYDSARVKNETGKICRKLAGMLTDATVDLLAMERVMTWSVFRLGLGETGRMDGIWRRMNAGVHHKGHILVSTRRCAKGNWENPLSTEFHTYTTSPDWLSRQLTVSLSRKRGCGGDVQEEGGP